MELKHQRLLCKKLREFDYQVWQIESKSGDSLPDIMFLPYGVNCEPYFFESKTTEGKLSVGQEELQTNLKNNYLAIKSGSDFYILMDNQWITLDNFIKVIKEKKIDNKDFL